MTNEETTLLAEDRGPAAEVAAPLWLHERPGLWLVTGGRADLYALRLRGGAPASAPRFLGRLEAGQVLVGHGLPADPDGVALLARPGAGARLRVLAAGAPELGGAAWLDAWLALLGGGLEQAPVPRRAVELAAGQELALSDGEAAVVGAGPLWVRASEGGLRWLGHPDLPALEAGIWVPLAPQSWVAAEGPARLAAADSAAIMGAGDPWPGLTILHHMLLVALRLADEARRTEARRRVHSATAADRRAVQRAVSRLASVLTRGDEQDATTAEEPLLAACRLVGAAIGAEIRPPVRPTEGMRRRDPLELIARASRLRLRRVALRGDWWRRDGGPLLAYSEGDRRPIALIPARGGSYTMHDPARGQRGPLSAAAAATLEPFAATFFRPFPDKPLSALELVRFGLRGVGGDVTALLLTGLALGLLGLAAPIVTGVVIDSVIPNVNHFKLLQLTMALVVAAFAMALFQLVRAAALLRLEARMSGSIQAAVWDRLLNLPAPFFRAYSAGDLAARVNGIDAIRSALTGTILSSILSGVFSLLNFGLLFSYDAGLALVALLLVAVACGATFGLSYLGLRYERQLSVLQASLSGMVLQLLSGISKLRVAGAEARAFAVWAERFTAQRQVAFRARVFANVQAVFNAAFPIITSIVLFGTIIGGGAELRSTGTILAFMAAFGGLLAAALAVSGSMISILRVIPLYENARPVLTALPEVDLSKIDPGELTGAIEVSHVSFRYEPGGPLILDDVSLEARPGEFIAVVGPSGSGKSTLFRLLLGFERPSSGALYVDGQDLAELDLQAVRRQVGTVLQNGKLMPGDIFSNIVGSSLLSVDDAWEAAEMSGLADDIRQMPMGLHTLVSEGGSTFSGGQRQRLMIARAIVNRPRILLFDEATSALDNRTQAIVSRSLERLQATRLVIAHRLSTIVNANRIYVVEGGRVVQQGSYAELAERDGPFKELIRRQLV